MGNPPGTRVTMLKSVPPDSIAGGHPPRSGRFHEGFNSFTCGTGPEAPPHCKRVDGEAPDPAKGSQPVPSLRSWAQPARLGRPLLRSPLQQVTQQSMTALQRLLPFPAEQHRRLGAGKGAASTLARRGATANEMPTWDERLIKQPPWPPELPRHLSALPLRTSAAQEEVQAVSLSQLLWRCWSRRLRPPLSSECLLGFLLFSSAAVRAAAAASDEVSDEVSDEASDEVSDEVSDEAPDVGAAPPETTTRSGRRRKRGRASPDLPLRHPLAAQLLAAHQLPAPL